LSSVNAEHRIVSVTPGFTAIPGLEPTQLLDRGHLFYQPPLDSHTARISGYESEGTVHE
jgi:hypothetical protein